MLNRKNDCHIVPNGKVQNAHLFGLVVLAAIASSWCWRHLKLCWRHGEEETTQVGGGKDFTVCLCKRSHEGERVTGQLSHNALATAHEYNGTWPNSEKQPWTPASCGPDTAGHAADTSRTRPDGPDGSDTPRRAGHGRKGWTRQGENQKKGKRRENQKEGERRENQKEERREETPEGAVSAILSV